MTSTAGIHALSWPRVVALTAELRERAAARANPALELYFPDLLTPVVIHRWNLAWLRVLRAGLMLDLGLIFEVVVAFAIALSENATAWPPDHPIRGISWNCLWISTYVVAIPGTYGKNVLAAFAAAAMAPFGLLVATTANGHPMPQPEQMLVLLLPPFVAAA